MITIKRYLPLFVLAAIYILIILTQLPIIENLWQYSFDDGTYSHAFLIPFISMYLYWILFESNRLILNDKINLPILLINLAVAYMLWTSINAHFPTGYRLSFVLFMTSITALVFKPSVKQIFPALFLIFLIPVWGGMTSTLQSISSHAVGYMMSLTHIPTYLNGNLIEIPAGTFEIAGGCSGLRYLIVSLAISSLFTFLNIRKLSHCLWFFFFAIIGALITNWIRITALILIGHYTDMQSSLMYDHNTFGWYLFIPFMIALFYFGQQLIATEEPTNEKPKNQNNKSIFNNLIITIIIIVAISDPVKMLLSNTALHNSNCENMETNLPQPQLSIAPSLCKHTKENGDLFEYQYSGINLEHAVDSYLNKFTPNSWLIIKSFKDSSKNVLIVEKNKQTFQVTYFFKSGTESVGSLTTLKKMKLVNAFKGIHNTALIWKVTPCNNSCEKHLVIDKY